MGTPTQYLCDYWSGWNYLKEQTLYKLKVKIYSENDPTSGIRACVETLNKKNSIEKETSAPPAPKTAKQLVAKRNQERVKSILLLAIPDEYLLKFHNVADAKSLWEAIKSRFGGNEESKKMQKNIDIDGPLQHLRVYGVRIKGQEPKLKTVVNTGPRVDKPVWDNTKRVYHQKFSKYPHLRKTFVPSGVLTRTGLIIPVKQNEKRAVHKVGTARPVCIDRPVSTARLVSTVRPCALKITQTSGAIRPIYPRMDNGVPLVLVVNHTTNGHQFTMSNRLQELASPKQTVLVKTSQIR
ncbi:hypothetical protein Tco_0305374 [Tanacetum coccineum]